LFFTSRPLAASRQVQWQRVCHAQVPVRAIVRKCSTVSRLAPIARRPAASREPPPRSVQAASFVSAAAIFVTCPVCAPRRARATRVFIDDRRAARRLR
jgi:hypothetical protein